MVIDLHPTRSGRSYAVGWDNFGLIGDMLIITVNMTGLIAWLLEAGGNLPAGGNRPYRDAYRPTL